MSGQPWKSGSDFYTHWRGASVCFRSRCRSCPPISERVLFRSFLNCASTTSFIRLGKKRLNGKSDRIIDFWKAVLTRRGRSLFIFQAPWRSIRFAMRQNQVIGAIIRQQQSVEGTIDIAVQPLAGDVFKISVTVENHTPVSESELNQQEEVLMRTFASTHTILESARGEFLSLMDPPPAYVEASKTCSNIGTWPVLVGEKEKGEAVAMLSSPIILYDYPEIAQESPGEFFDGTEIDEILTLRVLTMTDQEKWEMSQGDEHARRILHRTEELPEEAFWQMHGTIRDRQFSSEDFFDPNTRLEHVTVNGTDLKIGHRVQIRPQGRADVMDLALEGKIAVIESIEQDAENRVYLALVLDEDPGKDLGMLRQPGHRFFYGVNEVEPLTGSQ